MSNRRRTLIANEIPNLTLETEEVDDEAEKRNRMSEAPGSAAPGLQRLQSRLGRQDSSTPSPATGKTPTIPIVAIAPKPSNEQLSCLYNNCVKLLNENKINAKNAFQLKLIDYMSDIVLNSEISGGVTNFQVVGCTIDVGSKIYAARVDALHQNTYQVLSGLNHQSAETGDNDNEGGDDGGNGGMDDSNGENGGGEVSEEQLRKKEKAAKKRRLKKSCHIVSAENMDSITLKMRDEYKDEDLYFAKKSTCIENEAIGGILLNKLHIQNDTIKMMINADDKQYSESSERPRDFDSEICDFKGIVDSYVNCSADLKGMKLCADLSTFKFIDYQNDENDVTKLVDSMIQPELTEELKEHQFDANNLQLSRFDISQQGADNIDMDDVNDYDNVENMEMNGVGNDSRMAHQASGLDLLDDMRVMNSISDLSTLISSQPSDYSYFNFDKLKMVNLPKHLKKIANEIQSERGPNYDPTKSSAVTQRNARTKRVVAKLDFGVRLENMKFFKITKKACYLNDKVIEKRSEKPMRLETERQFNYEARELFRTYLKPITAKIINDPNSVDLIENLLNCDEAMGQGQRYGAENNATNGVTNARNDDNDNDDNDIGNEFEIPGTAQTNEPFFCENGAEYMQSQQVDIHMDEMPGGDLNGSQFDGDNLIEAPLQVNALRIEYAKTSKTIDVRKLKTVIWGLLCNNDGSDKENVNISANDTGSDMMNKTKVVVNVNASLKAIYRQLIPPLIKQKEYDDLSSSIVFQMVLFLANEHNLLLTNDAMGTDVQITNY